jgi:hypothetical protein
MSGKLLRVSSASARERFRITIRAAAPRHGSEPHRSLKAWSRVESLRMIYE